MESIRFTSKEPQDQEGLCKYIATALESYPVVLFSGEMGAGKTSLIKNICTLLKVKDAVSSPTFSLVNEYETTGGEKLYHFDFYRINDIGEALDMGCEEYVYSGRVCLIEWPEKIQEILPEKYLSVKIEVEQGERIITLSKIN